VQRLDTAAVHWTRQVGAVVHGKDVGAREDDGALRSGIRSRKPLPELKQLRASWPYVYQKMVKEGGCGVRFDRFQVLQPSAQWCWIHR